MLHTAIGLQLGAHAPASCQIREPCEHRALLQELARHGAEEWRGAVVRHMYIMRRCSGCAGSRGRRGSK